MVYYKVSGRAILPIDSIKWMIKRHLGSNIGRE